MSAYTPNFAPVVVLLFLGAVFVTGVTLLVLFSGLRLLVTDKPNEWLSRVIIGHEDSFLHKKIYLGLEPKNANPSSSIWR
jgi:hypothetical protein